KLYFGKLPRLAGVGVCSVPIGWLQYAVARRLCHAACQHRSAQGTEASHRRPLSRLPRCLLAGGWFPAGLSGIGLFGPPPAPATWLRSSLRPTEARASASLRRP